MMWSDYVISLVQGGERNVEVIRDAERTAGCPIEDLAA